MGNAVGVELSPPSIDELLQNKHHVSMKEGSICDEFNSVVRIWAFSPSKKDALFVIREPVCLSRCKGFDGDSCYIILHCYGTERMIEKGGNAERTPNIETSFQLSVLDLALSAKTNLSPRGQQTCFAGFHSVANSYCKFFSGNNNKYDLYIWNGIHASQATKAIALAKIFELDGALKEGDTSHFQSKPEKYNLVPMSSIISCDNACLSSEDWTPLLQQNHLLSTVNENSPFFDDGYPLTPPSSKPKSKSRKLSVKASNSGAPIGEKEKKKKKHRRGIKRSDHRKNENIPKLALDSQFPITKTNFHSISLPASKLSNLKISMEDFRLDFGQIQPNSELDTERESKAKKIARLNPICSLITESLYLGSDTAAQDCDQLKRCGITHILNCAATICKNYFPTEFIYKSLYLYDGSQEKIDCLFYNVLEFIDDAVSSGGVVFIHCQQGISRSSAMLILYLMWKHNKPYTETHEFVKSQRAIVNPNAAFTAQLLIWWSIRTNPKPITVYIITQHRKEAPELSVLRRLDAPQCVDPRFCFIIFNHIAGELYLWRGSSCCYIHKKEGLHYIKLLQHFENAPIPFKKENQGKESTHLVSCFREVKTVVEDPANDSYYEVISTLEAKRKSQKKKQTRRPSLYSIK